MSITLYETVEGEVVGEQNKINEAIRGLLAELDPLSQKKYQPTIAEFLQYGYEHPGPMSVVFSSYLGWLRERELAPSTINGKRVVIRRFAEWAARIGHIDNSEYLKVKDVKGIQSSGSKRGKWLTKPELECLLAAPDTSTQAGKRDRAILAFLIGCATRREEMTKFTWSQLVRQGNVWIIENAKRKHHRTQEAIVVPGFVKLALDVYMPERSGEDYIFTSYNRWGHSRGHLTAQAIYNIVQKYSRQCGFEGIAPHDLRRSAAQSFRDKGLEIEQISKALGHNSILTTQRYLAQNMDLEKIAAAAEL